MAIFKTLAFGIIGGLALCTAGGCFEINNPDIDINANTNSDDGANANANSGDDGTTDNDNANQNASNDNDNDNDNLNFNDNGSDDDSDSGNDNDNGSDNDNDNGSDDSDGNGNDNSDDDDDSDSDGNGNDNSDEDGDDDSTSARTMIRMGTPLGDIRIELLDDVAPITVGNFLQYVRDGFYDGGDNQGATVFHRIVPAFVIQGGGFASACAQKETRDAITNEAEQTPSNLRGTLSMAQTSQVNSGTSQFFINLIDNTNLDFTATFQGHAVFGTVVEGIDIADTIAAVETGSCLPPDSTCESDGLPTSLCELTGVPVDPVIIMSVTIEDEG